MHSAARDYQHFDLTSDDIQNVGWRMQAKLGAVPIPDDLTGKTVLDVGCDMGFWSFLARQRGAETVLGLDRGRPVQGEAVDLVARNRRAAQEAGIDRVDFAPINLGAQWTQFGGFDLTLCLSMYHHAFAQCGDHGAIWLWLRMHTTGELLWEGPTTTDDPVVRGNVPKPLWQDYTAARIFGAARQYFNVEYIGPAEHEGTRDVYRCAPKAPPTESYAAVAQDGAGGASKAFLYADDRRRKEIAAGMGWMPWPGTLNALASADIDWGSGYFRLQLMDVVSRREGLDSEWAPRWCRIYPVAVNGQAAAMMRFEGEAYPASFVELIAPNRLRDSVTDRLEIVKWR